MLSAINFHNSSGNAVSTLVKNPLLLTFIEESYLYKTVLDVTYLDNIISMNFNLLKVLFILISVLVLILKVFHFQFILLQHLVIKCSIISYVFLMNFGSILYYVYCLLISIRDLNHLNDALMNYINYWCVEQGIHINYPLDTRQYPTFEFNSDWIGAVKSIDDLEHIYNYLNLAIFGIGVVIVLTALFFSFGGTSAVTVAKGTVSSKAKGILVTKAWTFSKKATIVKSVTFSKEAIISETLQSKGSLTFLWQSKTCKSVLAKIAKWEAAKITLGLNSTKEACKTTGTVVEAIMDVARAPSVPFDSKLQYLTKQEAAVCNTAIEGVNYVDVNQFLLTHQDAFLKLAGYVSDSHWDFPV